VPRGFGFVHHSIAILYHQVPNPNITIRNFFIAVRYGRVRGGGVAQAEAVAHGHERAARSRALARRAVGAAGRGTPPHGAVHDARRQSVGPLVRVLPPTLGPTVYGNTVRSFPTHGQLSAAQGSPTQPLSQLDIRLI
jgi:hypothetical protein